LRGNGSWQLWALVLWVLFVLFIVLPWISRHVERTGDTPYVPGGSVHTAR
jgi:hypothetical protein